MHTIHVNKKKKTFSRLRISPLIGMSLTGLIQLVSRHAVHPPYITKLMLPFLLAFLTTPLRLIDRMRLLIEGQKLKGKELEPLFIIGHWRSGTTHLHNLLSLDAQKGYMDTYMSVFPEWDTIKTPVKRFIGPLLNQTRPGDNVRISLDHPQEDEFALNNLGIHSYYHFMYFPEDYKKLYENYVSFASSKKKKAWIKNYVYLLQKIARIPGKKQLILKNPVNTARLSLLTELFPKAKFIFIHRHPVDVYLSTVNFYTQLFAELNLQNFASEDIPELVIDVYQKLLNDYLQQKESLPAHQLIEVSYDELDTSPQATVRQIYRQLKMNYSEAFDASLKKYIHSVAAYKKSQRPVSPDTLDRLKSDWAFAFEEWNYTHERQT